jgi:hypothetical protein
MVILRGFERNSLFLDNLLPWHWRGGMEKNKEACPSLYLVPGWNSKRVLLQQRSDALQL